MYYVLFLKIIIFIIFKNDAQDYFYSSYDKKALNIPI